MGKNALNDNKSMILFAMSIIYLFIFKTTRPRLVLKNISLSIINLQHGLHFTSMPLTSNQITSLQVNTTQIQKSKPTWSQPWKLRNQGKNWQWSLYRLKQGGKQSYFSRGRSIETKLSPWRLVKGTQLKSGNAFGSPETPKERQERKHLDSLGNIRQTKHSATADEFTKKLDNLMRGNLGQYILFKSDTK